MLVDISQTILISGSMRFKQEMTDFSNKLKDLGYQKVIEPSDVEYIQENNLIGKAQNHLIFSKLIKLANLLLIYNKEGYIGVSTAMEIQMAIDSKVPVVFLFEPEALEFKSLCLHEDFDVKIDKRWINIPK